MPVLTCPLSISFSAFQHAIVRSLNDKNAQLQKQLDSVIREANSELSLLNNKKNELEKDLELERRKVRELQEGSRERDKEYQKLKAHFDKLKRKTVFGPQPGNEHGPLAFLQNHQGIDDQRNKTRQQHGNSVDLSAVVEGMATSGAQRTPLVPRTNGGSHFLGGGQQHTSANEWTQDQARLNTGNRPVAHRQPFPQFPASAATFSDRSHRVGSTTNISDRSGSANEVERMLMHKQPSRPQPINTNSGWHVNVTHNASTGVLHGGQHHLPPPNQKGWGFRSAVRTFVVDYALNAVHGATGGFGAGPSTRNTRPSNSKFRPAIPK